MMDKTTITDMADDIGSAAKGTKAKAAVILDDVKEDVAVLAGKAGSSAKSAATTGKDKAADALHELASAARDLAAKLDDGTVGSNNAKVASYARKAAESVDRFSDKVKAKDIDTIANDARSSVRNKPAIAVGAAALIGFALARFLKGGSGGRA